MNTIEAGLLSVSCGLICLAVATGFNSRKIYLQEQQMAVGKAEVLAAIAAEREQVLEAIRKVQDENQPEDLSDLLAAVQGIYEDSPVSPETETLPDEVVAEPVTDESGEVVGGVLPDESSDLESGPAGEATPEGETASEAGATEIQPSPEGGA
jgi:hypothetical protein